MDLEDKDGLTPLMHGLLAVRSSMDSESAVRAVSVLAQHSKPGSLRAQEDGGWGTRRAACIVNAACMMLFLKQLAHRKPRAQNLVWQENLETVVKSRLTSRSELIVAARDGQVKDVRSFWTCLGFLQIIRIISQQKSVSTVRFLHVGSH